MTVKPIYTATINGHPVQMFASPMKDGRPDFPWHSVGELAAALCIPVEDRDDFLRHIRTKCAQATAIATAPGITLIAPHFAAQGVIDAMVVCNVAPASSRDEYGIAVVAASKVLERFDGRAGTLEYVLAARKRWEGA